jgi:uncharacterized membrane protein YbhN (UPF0104 family)
VRALQNFVLNWVDLCLLVLPFIFPLVALHAAYVGGARTIHYALIWTQITATAIALVAYVAVFGIPQ